MGLFSKKDDNKKSCPICGGKMGFLSSEIVEDGEICDNCAEKIRPMLADEEVLSRITIEEAKNKMAGIERRVNEIANATGASAIFEIYMAEILEPKMGVVGIKKAKEHKGRIGIQGCVNMGAFMNGDSVVIISGETETEATIYGVYEAIDRMDLDEIISTGSRKKGITEGMQSYIVLAEEGLIPPDGSAKIIKK